MRCLYTVRQDDAFGSDVPVSCRLQCPGMVIGGLIFLLCSARVSHRSVNPVLRDTHVFQSCRRLAVPHSSMHAWARRHFSSCCPLRQFRVAVVAVCLELQTREQYLVGRLAFLR